MREQILFLSLRCGLSSAVSRARCDGRRWGFRGGHAIANTWYHPSFLEPLVCLAGCVEALLRFLSRCSLSLCVSKSQVRRRRVACACVCPASVAGAAFPHSRRPCLFGPFIGPVSSRTLALRCCRRRPCCLPPPKMCDSSWQPFSSLY